MAKKGIDVSVYQGKIDWAKVKKAVDFAILRVGYGQNISSQDDSKWKENVKGCQDNNIPFGVYIYSYATTDSAAISEADHVIRLISGKTLSYPVFYDMEDSKQGSLSASKLGSIADSFCRKIKNAGYYPAIYANTYWFTNKLTSSVFNRYDKWVAQYASSCKYAGTYQMWQYTSDGTVDGINGRVDMNYCYVDYPAIIRGNSVSDTNISVSNFVKAVQSYYGMTQTGTANETLLNQTPTISASVNSTHYLVRPIQKRLMTMGYTQVGAIDGEAGPKFSSAISALQKDRNITQNGVLRAKSNTWKVLLDMPLPTSDGSNPIAEPTVLPDYYSGGINNSIVPYKEPTMSSGGIAMHPCTNAVIARSFTDLDNYKFKVIQNNITIK